MYAQLSDAGPISDVIIDGCEVYDCNTGPNELMTMYGEVSNFEITNCIVHDGTNINMDMIGRDTCSVDCNQPAGSLFGRPSYGLIKGNVCYNAGAKSWGSGIYGDGAGKPDLPDNIIIEDNICYGNDFCGIEMGDEHNGESSGGILIRRNICYNNQYSGFNCGGGGVGYGGTVKNCTFINNVSYQNGHRELDIAPCQNITVKNNIFYRSASGILIYWTAGSGTGNTADYNCWYPDGEFQWEGTEYSSFSDYQSGTNQGVHSICENPLFVDAGNLDFHIESGSPCRNAGTDVGLSYKETAPDMGVYEYEDGLSTAKKLLTPANSELQIFSNASNISYSLSRAADVNIGIFNSIGQQLYKESVSGKSAGIHEIPWDRFSAQTGGFCIIRISSGGEVVTAKVALMK